MLDLAPRDRAFLARFDRARGAGRRGRASREAAYGLSHEVGPQHRRTVAPTIGLFVVEERRVLLRARARR